MIVSTRQGIYAVDLYEPELFDQARYIGAFASKPCRAQQEVAIEEYAPCILICDYRGFHRPVILRGRRLTLVSAIVLPYLANTMAKKTENPNYKVIAENRRARFDYSIEDDLECGIVLSGSEVKSLRAGGSNIADSYASVDDGELWLTNAYIAPYKQAMFPHEERRKRKLLVSRRELSRLWNATQRQGMTLVPLVLYFNHKGRVKIKIATAKGKQKQDKRAAEAKRDWGRQKQRLLRDNS